MEIETLIEQFEQDYENEVGPFDPADFPESRVCMAVADNDMAEVLTYLVMLDYNRSADMLVDNILELYDDDQRWFDPQIVQDADQEELADVFAEIGFRYPNRDSTAWVENSALIADRFGGIGDMLLAADYSAPELVELLRDHEIKYLQGDKLAPFYSRVMHQHVVPLHDTHKLPIPVDTHIRRLTKDLVGEVSDDEIREFWTEASAKADTEALTVDRYLWLIGYNWESGGEDYWNSVVSRGGV
jgi:endonuclease III